MAASGSLALAGDVDSLGLPTGIEAEEPEHDAEHIRQPFDPDQIDVITRNPTVDLLLSRIRSGSIDLQPDFQRRRGIWTDERQSRLIESLLLRIPLPTLYAAENADEGWAIVDGIQRLTSIARFIAPETIGDTRLRLSGLEYLGDSYEGASFEDLPGRLQTRLKETELVLHLIRQGTPEEVKFNIFVRINTGGLPLSSQELRHALIPGPAREYLKSWASLPEFRDATGGSIRDERMADREMVLRFVAFRLQDPASYTGQDFDAFLRSAMKRMNLLPKAEVARLEAEFLRSLIAAQEIFEQYAFRKRYSREAPRSPINKALFEAVSTNLAALKSDEADHLVARRTEVQDGVIAALHDYNFERAISQGTGDAAKVRLRFNVIRDLFKGILDA